VAFASGVRAAIAAGDRTRAEALVRTAESAGHATIPPLVRAHAMRFRAQLQADAGDLERGDRLFRGAAAIMRELATPFPMAVTMLDHAEVLLGAGDPDTAEPLVAEARSVFADLGAVPWIERADRLAALAGDRVAS
jgi:hypothetical protein